MERWGEPLKDYPLRTLETGITYKRQFGGLVPEIEEREAARYNGYTWKEWRELPREERVDGIAFFRIRRSIELHQQDAQNKEQERQSKQAAKKGRR